MQIYKIIGREILDSRGYPTVEAEVILTNGSVGRASVPSGASTGSLEACEIRDADNKRYHGKGVLKAVEHINQLINQCLQGADVADQASIDARLIALDGSPAKTRLGANAILAVSLASARAYSESVQQPLYQTLNQGEKMVMPVPLMNILNGGVHADNNVDIQEFMIMPVGTSQFSTALQMGAEVFHCLKSLLKEKGFATAVGDEGGFAPDLASNAQALDLLSQAVEQAGFRVGREIVFALDVAASELYQDNYYHLNSENKKLNAEQLIDYYKNLIKNYPIVSIEDGLDEQDKEGWQELTRQLGNQLQIVGDDLFVTNPKILAQGIKMQLGNAILIKLNQIGTLTETRQTIALARDNHYNCIISHRSGETEDSFIADFAVATGIGQIKTGSLCRTDRLAKYNQLLRIEEQSRLPYYAFKI